MKTKTGIKSGAGYMNHNATRVRVRTSVKSGAGYVNHNATRVSLG